MKRPTRRNTPAAPPEDGDEIRLQVYLARAGVASRRASEKLIADGRVFVNGSAVTEMGTKVVPGRDVVEAEGKIVGIAPPQWLMLHKPRGYISTRDDPRGRRTIYRFLPPEHRSLFHVGRLDRASEGLILLTNAGEIANRLLHPRFGLDREYRVDIEGYPTPETLERITRGVELDDGPARAESVQLVREVERDVFRLQIVLREGRNREVRRLFDTIGHPVQRLVRTRFGPIELGDLPPGRWRRLSAAEIRSLRALPADRSAP